jgi:hypothetical protein
MKFVEPMLAKPVAELPEGPDVARGPTGLARDVTIAKSRRTRLKPSVGMTVPSATVF